MEPLRKPINPAVDKLFEPFRSFLYEAAGIYVQDQNKDRLLAHVAARMAATGKTDPAQYLTLVRSARGPRSELWEFFNQVTVNETYFFREPQQFDVFRDRVLPQLFEKRRKDGRDKVVIWSAACSSGEEAYTLAILAKEHFPNELPYLRILGFDLNSEVVDKANRAEYGDYSVRTCTDAQKAAYFKKVGAVHQLVPYIKRLATFQVANLMEPAALRLLPRPDLILCRNALIYFDKDSKSKVLGNLSSALLPHGYLFLSLTETLFNCQHSLETVHFFKACGYRLKT